MKVFTTFHASFMVDVRAALMHGHGVCTVLKASLGGSNGGMTMLAALIEIVALLRDARAARWKAEVNIIRANARGK